MRCKRVGSWVRRSEMPLLALDREVALLQDVEEPADVPDWGRHSLLTLLIISCSNRGSLLVIDAKKSQHV